MQTLSAFSGNLFFPIYTTTKLFRSNILYPSPLCFEKPHEDLQKASIINSLSIYLKVNNRNIKKGENYFQS